MMAYESGRPTDSITTDYKPRVEDGVSLTVEEAVRPPGAARL